MAQIFSRSSDSKQEKEKCVKGKIHVHTGMKLLLGIGFFVIIILAVLLYLKFKKAMFVLLIPLSISLAAVAGMLTKKPSFIWPVIAVSCFHVVLASYFTIIFLFYFIFKPFYIIMVLNWAFDTLHQDKTPSYYVQCAGIFLALITFLLFNLWQGSVSYSYHRLLIRSSRSTSSFDDLRAKNNNNNSPTVLVVNSRPLEYTPQY